MTVYAKDYIFVYRHLCAQVTPMKITTGCPRSSGPQAALHLKSRHDSVMEITAWVQECFQKSLSVKTVHDAIHKHRLKLYHEKKIFVTRIQKATIFSGPKLVSKWTEARR